MLRVVRFKLQSFFSPVESCGQKRNGSDSVSVGTEGRSQEVQVVEVAASCRIESRRDEDEGRRSQFTRSFVMVKLQSKNRLR